jgi:CRP-like cAMP-binding protein
MADMRRLRISRELFLATLDGTPGALEPWVGDRLTALLGEEDIAPGDVLFTPGDPPDDFHFVRHGRVELSGGGLPAQLLTGPCVVGLADVVIERPRNRTARALDALEAMRVPGEPWMELLEDSFNVARRSLVTLASAVAVLEERHWARGDAPSHGSRPVLALPPDGHLGVLERLAVLMEVPFLGAATIQPLADLAVIAEEVSLAAGERILARGAPRDRVFVPFQGRVEARRENPPLVWRGGPGEVVCGTLSFVEAGSAWEARASSDVRAVTFAVEDWFDLLEENFEMVRSTLAALALERERLLAVLG